VRNQTVVSYSRPPDQSRAKSSAYRVRSVNEDIWERRYFRIVQKNSLTKKSGRKSSGRVHGDEFR
jgi:hypothetical protein